MKADKSGSAGNKDCIHILPGMNTDTIICQSQKTDFIKYTYNVLSSPP